MAEHRYAVRCPDYQCGSYLVRKQAERKAAELNHMGGCKHTHVVVEATRDEHGVWRLDDGSRL